MLGAEYQSVDPLPERLNYVFWMQDLLDTTGNDFYDGYDPIREVVGLDMYAVVC